MMTMADKDRNNKALDQGYERDIFGLYAKKNFDYLSDNYDYRYSYYSIPKICMY